MGVLWTITLLQSHLLIKQRPVICPCQGGLHSPSTSSRCYMQYEFTDWDLYEPFVGVGMHSLSDSNQRNIRIVKSPSSRLQSLTSK